MYVYFKLTNYVLTCEEYPQILSVKEMKLNKLENMCNKWEKNISEDGTFTLSFRYNKPVCDCDNSQYIHIIDYDDYECYNCGISKTSLKEGDNLYLQNSCSIDIVCVKPINNFCQLCEVNGYPNIYKWVNNNNKRIFALHIKNNMLSDEDVSNEINIIQQNCHITFTECI
jgi:hypothetical protein